LIARKSEKITMGRDKLALERGLRSAGYSFKPMRIALPLAMCQVAEVRQSPETAVECVNPDLSSI
jgi:hypothetical protein